ncbi:di-trans,poly-cis-decaprenylcistransferase [Candidatus Dojkabacteria bacterium]|nr:di-trans,poly-cis-decaprenylcistransferase [Candidatus Dojkabacteria bacterium]
MSNLKHLAIILDGNRRWARERGLSTFEGHRVGYERIKDVSKWCLERNIKILTVYAFSTENWNRSKEEVKYLMTLMNKAFSEELEELNKLGFKINIIGSRDRISKTIKKNIEKIENETKNNKKAILNICFNYGGRLEIVEAVKKIVEEGIEVEKINEELIGKYIWFKGQPEPDLIVRTSGEKRLSGFLTWTSVYSELYFPRCYWPDFDEKELDKAIKEFNKRNRRFGAG